MDNKLIKAIRKVQFHYMKCTDPELKAWVTKLITGQKMK